MCSFFTIVIVVSETIDFLISTYKVKIKEFAITAYSFSFLTSYYKVVNMIILLKDGELYKIRMTVVLMFGSLVLKLRFRPLFVHELRLPVEMMLT